MRARLHELTWRVGSVLAFAGAILLHAGPVRADTHVIVVGSAESPVPQRLEAELRAIGLVPERVERDTPPDRRELEELAREHGAGAAISIVPSARGAEVWIVDRITGKVVLREVVTREEDDESGALVALRAVELLRASLLEVSAAHPSRGEVEADEVIERLEEPPLPAPGPMSLGLGIGLTGAPGAPGPSAHVLLTMSARLHRWVEVRLAVWSPTWPTVISAAEGESDLWVGLLGLSVRVPLLERGAPVQPHVGLSAVGALLVAHGRAVRTGTAQNDKTLTVAPAIEVGARVPVASRLALAVNAFAAVTSNRIVIRFAEREVTTWGRPLLAASLALELALP